MSMNSTTEDWWKNNSMSSSTDSSHDDGSSGVYSHPLYKLSHDIWMVASPIVLGVGNFGNIMTLIIMSRQSSGEAVVNVYFTALAVVDLVILNVIFVDEWIGMSWGFYIHVQNQALCKIRNWVGGATTGIGAWFLVSLTAHRAASVVWPHKVNAFCSRRLVTCVLAAITVFLTAVYAHFLYGYHVHYFEENDEYMCIMMAGSYVNFVQNVFTYVDLAIYCLLPFVCIVASNGVLVRTLRGTIHQVRHQAAAEESVAMRQKTASSVTLTITTVSVTYLVLTLPVSLYFVSMFTFDYSGVTSDHDRAMNYAIMAVTFMLMYCNSSVNFYLYCLTGAKFRREFVTLFRGSRP